MALTSYYINIHYNDSIINIISSTVGEWVITETGIKSRASDIGNSNWNYSQITNFNKKYLGLSETEGGSVLQVGTVVYNSGGTLIGDTTDLYVISEDWKDGSIKLKDENIAALYLRENEQDKDVLAISYGEHDQTLYYKDYLKFEAVENTTISFNIKNADSTTAEYRNQLNDCLEYSIINAGSKYPATWNKYNFGSIALNVISGHQINLTQGQTCLFRTQKVLNEMSSEDVLLIGHYLNFQSTGNVNCNGNVLSIVSKNFMLMKSLNTPIQSLFRDCSKLLTAPKLLATTLTTSCYAYMFRGCTSLITPPELPATTLTAGCYWGMFQNCTSLTSTPALPATTLAENCYSNMFYRCEALTAAPLLPATTLAIYCYSGMFTKCTSLTTPPELFATTLANNCYDSMFYNCTSLTTPPTLPATTLANNCYQYMFSSCTSLTTVPNLPATTLANGCYSSMFSGCTSLLVSDTQYGNDNTSSSSSSIIGASPVPRGEYIANYTWRIPKTGVFTNTTTYNQGSMFYGCRGTRSSDVMSGAQGESHTYYTKYEPV